MAWGQGAPARSRVPRTICTRLSRETHRRAVGLVPAALKAKMEIKNILPPGSEPKSAQNHEFPWENVNPDPPPGPPGGGGAKIKIKNVLKHNWVVDGSVVVLHLSKPQD